MSVGPLSVHLSVRMEQLGSHWTDFLKFDISELFENLFRKFLLSFIKT